MTRALGKSNLIPRVINPNFLLVCAIVNSDGAMISSAQVETYLQHGIGTNNIDGLELHQAARCGKTKRAEEVVGRNKGLLSYKDSDGNVPLHVAVENGHKETALFLVKEHPQGLYALNGNNISPLYLAVQRRDLDLVKAMFSKLVSDDPAVVLDNLKKGKSIVQVAIKDKNQDMLEIIFKSQCELIKCTDIEGGSTPLSYAALNGNLEIVRYFLKSFPGSIRYPNKDKSNPFHKAVVGGHIEVLKELYSNPNTRDLLLAGDEHRRTVLHLAAKERGKKLRDVVSYLVSLNEGKDLINKKDENQLTPLQLAKKYSNHLAVEELIKGTKP